MVRKREEAEQGQQDASQLHDVSKKYNEVMKLLAEKELEINILRDLLKKTNPNALKDLK